MEARGAHRAARRAGHHIPRLPHRLRAGASPLLEPPRHLAASHSHTSRPLTTEPSRLLRLSRASRRPLRASTAFPNPNPNPNPNQAFEGLNCEVFEDTTGKQWRYLKSDYAVDCDDEEQYGPVFRLAWIAICLYPLGIPTMSAPPPPAPPPSHRPHATRKPPSRQPKPDAVPYIPNPSARQVLAATALGQGRYQDGTDNSTELSARVPAPRLRGELLRLGDCRAGSS